ncbi:MAG: dUTP diphosphatase [Rickettsiales bacterium]
MLKVKIVKLAHGDDLPLPSYATQQAAGVDLMAAVSEDIIIQPMDRRLIPTGISIALPADFEAQIRPRSGLALKHGITLLNCVGTIDADYRGEIKVIIVNLGGEEFTVKRGMRIAQMIIAPVAQISWISVDCLDETARDIKGFGSTGYA